MNIHGEAALEGPQEQIWRMLFDPDMLRFLIPGCEALESFPPGEYKGTIRIGVAAVAGIYDVLVKITDQTPPESCRLNGRITGSAGVITGTAELHLQPAGPACDLVYRASATITGPLAKLSPRLLEGVVKKLIDQGINNFNQELLNRKMEGMESADSSPKH